MKKLLTPLLAVLLAGCQQASTGAKPISVEEDLLKAIPIEVVSLEEEKETPKKLSLWSCPTCTDNERHVLKELQLTAGITCKNALATIMGNIKQESKFIPNICEGGARVPYNRCYRGGYGIVQWTTKSRYDGLGFFAKKFGCDPSTIECQTRYMINEIHFQKVLPEFKNGGFSVSQYMTPSYYWLGWGIEGPRMSYSFDYTKRFIMVDTEV